MNRYMISMAYNGTAYHGWQRQPKSQSVQQTLEHCLTTLLNNPVSVVGAGRTDTGVHASEYFAHFDLDEIIPEDRLNALAYRANRFLPPDIVIYSIKKVDTGFHSRFSALAREYKYYISRAKDPFNMEFSYHYEGTLCIEAMNSACKILFEYKDFSCFSKSHTQTKTNNCRIISAIWEEQEDKLIFTVEADRFLRNMVRAIVGTMMEIGKGKIQPADLHEIIKSKNRSNAGTSVPAHGLFLTEIKY